MVLELCGESISIPNGIAEWCHENPDNRTEFDGMIDSMIWAIKNKYKPKDNSSSEKGEGGDLFNSLLNLYIAALKK